ncbi:uncharacterized protein LOC121905475 [Xyrichtys novacula]|uniref:Uncharacterized protein LOC121905475 n=1 Tax=Xyrichtys novacula TaxID=13765 RepID=A0AAV1GAA5_XYRNO|nr:uncharacterized protein LOC121905475 [Xyrichtys novacula]
MELQLHNSIEDLYDKLFQVNYPSPATGISTCRSEASPRQQTLCPRNEDDISNWTVARLRRSLKARGIAFHRNDNKARLFLLYNSSTNTTAAAAVHPALPASPPEPITATNIRSDVTEQLPRPQLASSAPPGGDQAVSPPVPAPSVSDSFQAITAFFTSLSSQAAPSSRAHISFHPNFPFSSLPSASNNNFVPPLTTIASSSALQGAPPAIHNTGYSRPPPFPTDLSYQPSLPIPTPSLPQHTNVFPPPVHNCTLATAATPIQPASSNNCPSPISPALCQQILYGNYVDLAQLLHHPQLTQDSLGRCKPIFRPVQLRDPLPSRSELDDYLSIILDMALPHCHSMHRKRPTTLSTLTLLSQHHSLLTLSPPPPIIPKSLDIRPTVNVPMPKGVDKR